MLPPPPRPKFRFTRSRGLVLRREYHAFIAFLTEHAGGQITVTGVDRVSHPTSSSHAKPGADKNAVTPPPPARFTTPPNRGLTTRADHARFAAWLEQHCPPRQDQLDQAAQEADDMPGDAGRNQPHGGTWG